MPKWILLALISALTCNNATAKDCASYTAKISKLEDLRRHGGSAKQMERWRIQLDELNTTQFNCNREGSIQVVTGKTTSSTTKTPASGKNSRTTSTRQKLRSNNNQDPQLQKLLSTCNYWIEQTNKKPSADNSAFRDSACRGVDEKIAASKMPTATTAPNLRSLKECIKPNNLIDNDVLECQQGIRGPLWKH